MWLDDHQKAQLGPEMVAEPTPCEWPTHQSLHRLAPEGARDKMKPNSVTVIHHLVGSSHTSWWCPGWSGLGLGNHRFLLDRQRLLMLHWTQQNHRGVLSHPCLNYLRPDPQLLKGDGNTFTKSRQPDFQAVIAYHPRLVIFSWCTCTEPLERVSKQFPFLALIHTVWSNNRPSFVSLVK